MKTLNKNQMQPLKIRLLYMIIDILSVLIFPIVFSRKFKITPMQGYTYAIIFVLLIYMYKNVFIPKRPNKYFDILFFSIFLIMAIIFKFKLNIFISLISVVQLILFIIAKTLKKDYPLITSLIFNFITPIFLMIILTYAFTKFISPNEIVLILLINSFTLLADYIKFNYTSLFCLVIILLLTIILIITKYISIIVTLSMFAVLLLFTLIKYFLEIKVNSSLPRLILSLLQLF